MGSHLSNCITETSKPTLAIRSSFLDLRAPIKKKTSNSEEGPQFPDLSFDKPIKRSKSFSKQFGNLSLLSEGFLPSHNNIDLKNFTILREFDTDNVYRGKRYLVAKKSNPNLLYTMTNCKKSLFKEEQSDLYAIQRQVFESNNPFISNLHYLIENKNTLYIFQTYFSGLDLAFQVQKAGCFKEKIARFYLAEMILAIEGLPNNVTLFQSLIYYLDLKSMLLDRDGHLHMNIGSPLLRASKKLGSSMDERYNPPELHIDCSERLSHIGCSERFSHSSILAWKLGVFLYEMISGIKAYSNPEDVLQSNHLRFSHRFTSNAVDLIGKLLLLDPQKRLGNIDVSELKSHQFFAGIDWNEILEKRRIGPLALSSKQEKIALLNDENTLRRAEWGSESEEETGGFPSGTPRNSTAEKSFLSNVSEEEEDQKEENY